MMIWIFVGVVVATTMFIMVMYKHNREQLRTQFLEVSAINKEDFPLKDKPLKLDTQEKLEDMLWNLALQLKEKEKMWQLAVSTASELETKIEQVNQTSGSANHKKYLEDLKLELELTELECSNLQDQIRVISQRREELRHEVNKRQDQFTAAMNTLIKDLRFDPDERAGRASERLDAKASSDQSTPLPVPDAGKIPAVLPETGMFFGSGCPAASRRNPSRELLD